MNVEDKPWEKKEDFKGEGRKETKTSNGILWHIIKREESRRPQAGRVCLVVPEGVIKTGTTAFVSQAIRKTIALCVNLKGLAIEL